MPGAIHILPLFKYLYAATTALSAFLLFLVQPIIAKQILPWFGGSAAVWTTCLLFFQLVLLAGYFYSDALIRRVKPGRQAIIHTVLLVLSLLVLPIIPREAFKPDAPVAAGPAGQILLLLAATIGLPYLMLSTTGPLVQAWFARRYEGGKVYRLYALSNVASLAALAAYPPLIEPHASGRMQSWGWSAGYVVFAILAAAAAWGSSRLPVKSVMEPQPEAGEGADNTAAPTFKDQMLWLLLAALGSVMLLAVTNHVTQNVASVPFLWALMLAIYLLTFILCFDGRGWYRRGVFVVLAGVVSLLMLAALSWCVKVDAATGAYTIKRGVLALSWAVPLYAAGLFICCMFCHGELVARKPAPRHLTRFYLMVSLGGAVGGLLVGVVAPVVWSWYWEVPLALALVTVLGTGLSRGWLRLSGAVCFCAAVAGCLDYSRFIREDCVVMRRNFYGVLRVKATAPDSDEFAKWRLWHGVITHGEQYRGAKRRLLATTYYGEQSGVARCLLSLRAQKAAGAGQRVGLIGLGVGTLAAYGKAGDLYRIYELNPQVLEVARTQFSYLSQSPATIETPLGDARLVLEKEAGQAFDVLVIDAFASDAIPVHLITREAIALYRRHVGEEGAIVFNITNRYLDLTSQVRLLGDEIGWEVVRVVHDPPRSSPLYYSEWVVMTGNKALLKALRSRGTVEEVQAAPGRRIWTDDYNNLFEVLK